MYTFGKTKCAVDLEHRIKSNYDPKIFRKVAAFLNLYNIKIKELDEIKDTHFKRYVGTLMKKAIKATDLELPSEIKNMSINLLVTKIKQITKE